ncbi:MAG: hypothetical protein ACOX4O_04990 [Eubacteriales bacterium]|jgi:hypothetical protein
MIWAIILGVLWIVMLIIHIIYYLKNRDDRFQKFALILLLAAAAVCMILISSSGKDEAGAGVYAYYVNGVRVSSGFMVFGKNLGLSLICGVMANFSAMGTAYIFTDKLKLKFGSRSSFFALFLIMSGLLLLLLSLLPSDDAEMIGIIRIIGGAALLPGIIFAAVSAKTNNRE